MPALAPASLTVHRRALTALLVLTVLALGTLGAVPSLHEDLHHDAHQAQHACAIDLFALGVTFVDAPVVVPAPAFAVASLVAARPSADIPSTQIRQPPGRAPPVVSI
jgi:hypothetical protein